MSTFTRRQFGALTAATLLSALTPSLRAASNQGDQRNIHVALLADTHIIDNFYLKGSENGAEDNESILLTSERLIAARTLINSLKQPAIDHTFILGDFFHNYPSADYDFYFKNKTRLDHARELVDGFRMPVHIGFGNHDYAVKYIDREMSHRLFKAKLDTDPYYAVEQDNVRFLQINNFLGATQDRLGSHFDPGSGSFGETQLNWIEAQLEARKPTFIFLHYPLLAIAEQEFSDYGLPSLLRKYKDNIRLVAAGHVHRWMDFGRTWGARHCTVASTRYDPDAYMLLRIDRQSGEWTFLNADLVDWNTHFSSAYKPAAS